MKLHHLLQNRPLLLQRKRLADVAFAFDELGKFARRISTGNLRGAVELHLADPDMGLAWPVLVGVGCSQSVVDEHFLDKDVLDLADLLVFASGNERKTTFSFRLEELERRFLRPLQRELENAGVELAGEPDQAGDRTLE